MQPLPKLGPWREDLDQLLAANETKPQRKRLTLLGRSPPNRSSCCAGPGRRAHQSRWCYGKTPMQTFLDTLPIAKEKSIRIV